MQESSKDPSYDAADDDINIPSSQHPSNEIENSLIDSTNALSSSSNLVQEGIIAGKRIAKISVVTLLAIGIVEIITGYLSGSVVVYC